MNDEQRKRLYRILLAWTSRNVSEDMTVDELLDTFAALTGRMDASFTRMEQEVATVKESLNTLENVLEIVQ